MNNLKDIETITIPKPHFAKGEYVRYQQIPQAIKCRIYDLDKSEWLYQFEGHASFVSVDEIVATGIAWQ